MLSQPFVVHLRPALLYATACQCSNPDRVATVAASLTKVLFFFMLFRV
jgi:hypothetical protein